MKFLIAPWKLLGEKLASTENCRVFAESFLRSLIVTSWIFAIPTVVVAASNLPKDSTTLSKEAKARKTRVYRDHLCADGIAEWQYANSNSRLVEWRRKSSAAINLAKPEDRIPNQSFAISALEIGDKPQLPTSLLTLTPQSIHRTPIIWHQFSNIYLPNYFHAVSFLKADQLGLDSLRGIGSSPVVAEDGPLRFSLTFRRKNQEQATGYTTHVPTSESELSQHKNIFVDVLDPMSVLRGDEELLALEALENILKGHIQRLPDALAKASASRQRLQPLNEFLEEQSHGRSKEYGDIEVQKLQKSPYYYFFSQSELDSVKRGLCACLGFVAEVDQAIQEISNLSLLVVSSERVSNRTWIETRIITAKDLMCGEG